MRVRISIGRRGVTASVIMAFCLLSHAAVADPAALVTAFDHQARQMLKNAELSPADRQQRFHALVDEDFDFPTIVRYVLGRNWQTTPDDVRQEFARVFEDYVIEGNADRINAYNGPIAAATTVRTEGENITIVATSFSRRWRPADLDRMAGHNDAQWSQDHGYHRIRRQHGAVVSRANRDGDPAERGAGGRSHSCAARQACRDIGRCGTRKMMMLALRDSVTSDG